MVIDGRLPHQLWSFLWHCRPSDTCSDRGDGRLWALMSHIISSHLSPHTRSSPVVYSLDLSFCAFVPRIISSRSHDRAVFCRTETTSCGLTRTRSLRPGKIAVCYICPIPSPMNADHSQRRALKHFIAVPQCQADTLRPKFSRISLIYSTTMSKHSGVAALPQNRGSNAHGSASSLILNFRTRCT